MKVTVQKVIIDRDFVTKIAKPVWLWEVPVLEAKFGDGRVRMLETEQVEIQSKPDVAEEFARVASAHGKEFMEDAYGKGKAAMKAFESEFKKAFGAKKKPAAKKKAAAKKPAAEVAETGQGDPLAD
jgi:hypothetical protein